MIRHWSQVIEFVDDNNLITSYDTSNSLSIFQDIISKFQYWQAALQSTGGIINQENTSIYAWKWHLINSKLIAKNISVNSHVTNETLLIKSISNRISSLESLLPQQTVSKVNVSSSLVKRRKSQVSCQLHLSIAKTSSFGITLHGSRCCHTPHQFAFFPISMVSYQQTYP